MAAVEAQRTIVTARLSELERQSGPLESQLQKADAAHQYVKYGRRLCCTFRGNKHMQPPGPLQQTLPRSRRPCWPEWLPSASSSHARSSSSSSF